MIPPAEERINDLFDLLELALWGRFGNTWEANQMQRVRAFLSEHCPPTPAPDPALLRLREALETLRMKYRSRLHSAGGAPIRDMRAHATTCSSCRHTLGFIVELDQLLTSFPPVPTTSTAS